MNNQTIKRQILDKIESNDFDNIYEALHVVGGDIDTLEAIPFGKRNEPTRIAEDYTDGVIDGLQSIERLTRFVLSVPD